jgi:PAS domain S-box-containing protein
MPAERDISCYSTALLLEHGVRRGVSRQALLAGVRTPPAVLENPEEWTDHHTWTRLASNLALALGGGPGMLFRVGRELTKEHTGAYQLLFLRAAPLRLLIQNAGRHMIRSINRNLEVRAERRGRGVLEVSLRPLSRERYSPAICEFNRGCIMALMELRGLRSPRLEETACALRGDGACRLRLAWRPGLSLAGVWPRGGGRLVLEQMEASHQRLARQHSFLQSLLHGMPNPVYYQDLQGRYLGCNLAFCRFWGLSREEIVGRAADELFPPEQARLVAGKDRELLADGGSQVYEVSLPDAAGEERDVVFYTAAYTDDQGRAAGLVGSMMDVTASRRAEREKDQMAEQLRQAQKMEALGTLAGGIAHDFNNLLGAIVGFTELARERAEQGRPAGRELDQVLSASRRAQDLVGQILTFGRRSKTRMQRLDLNRAVHEAAAILERVLPKAVRLELGLDRSLAPVNADPNQVEQVLMNLATNAADAMPAGGTLLVATRQVELDERFCGANSGMEPGPHGRLTVRDTGVGMDPDTRRRIFEPFFTTKEPGRGTGLGLATVYGIMQAHHGGVICESSSGQGSAFHLYFPCWGPEAAAEKPPPVAGEALRGRGEGVLLVDDEPWLRELGQRMLEGAGYRAFVAANAEEALEAEARLAGELDLVVLDLGMPGMGGEDCLARLRARSPHLPVLVVTGYPKAADDPALAGAAGLLPKPFRSAQLLASVRRALDAAATAAPGPDEESSAPR